MRDLQRDLLGRLFTFLLSGLRDYKLRKESEQAALRDLIKQVDELYRSTKQIKRMIRSRSVGPVANGVLLWPRDIDAAFFAARMDDLSNTQLKLEQVRITVRTRSDLFDELHQARILKEIGYSEK